MHRDTILILDFGSQYTQLIARRLRELSVYSEILPPGTRAEALQARHPRGIVLSGGPDSVHQRKAPRCDPKLFELGVPVVGICYGMQLMSHVLGGEVKRSGHREYGQADVRSRGERGASSAACRRGAASGRATATTSGERPRASASPAPTETNPIAAIEDARAPALRACCSTPRWSTPRKGAKVLANFLDVTGCRRDWNARSFVEEATERVREQVGPKGSVICALSGGVDSAVAALIVQARDRRAAHLRLRRQRPAAQGRGAAGAQALRGAAAPEGGLRRRLAALPARARGRHRPRAQAQDHRPRVHRGVPGLDAQDGQGRLPGAGHALPGRDRVGLGARPLGRDQEPPQRGRPAEGDEVQAGRAAALPVQGRGAQGRASSSGSTRSSSTASRSRARASRCAASAR